METFSFKTSVAVIAAAFVAAPGTFAAVVYDNTAPSSDKGRIFSFDNNLEIGDQIILSGSDRRVTEFSFPYVFNPGDSDTVGNETITFSIYDNLGANGSPGSLLLSSGPVAISIGSELNTFTALGLTLDVPTTFTWTVTFGGIDAGESAGLLIFDPPTVGASFNDFWQKNGGTWASFIDSDGGPGNFSARVTAIPEPSTMALAMVSGLALLGYRNYRRRVS